MPKEASVNNKLSLQASNQYYGKGGHTPDEYLTFWGKVDHWNALLLAINDEMRFANNMRGVPLPSPIMLCYTGRKYVWRENHLNALCVYV